MKKKKVRDTPVLVVSNGYEFEDLFDTDDSEFADEEPATIEEVKIVYGRTK